MLQHRSGITNFVDHPEYWSKPPKNKEETLAYGLNLPATFKPNAAYGYSNTAYMLISDLIDKVLVYSYRQYIKEEFLIPLGLKNIFGSIHEVNIDDVISGYYVRYEEDQKNGLYRPEDYYY